MHLTLRSLILLHVFRVWRVITGANLPSSVFYTVIDVHKWGELVPSSEGERKQASDFFRPNNSNKTPREMLSRDAAHLFV
jgi:hypothetical protein